MSVVVVFLLSIAAVSGWWLVQQGLMSKPWLETGAGSVAAQPPQPNVKIGLVVFLAVVGCLFALFSSAYFMRMEYADWRTMPLPDVVWLNTALLVLSSFLLHCAVVALRTGDRATIRIGATVGGVAAAAFLVGQLLAWRDLTASGFLLAQNPANSFFYLITGMHGLHILGGLVVLVPAIDASWRGAASDRLRLRIELCATYWHVLLFIWLGLVVLFLGWARGFVDLCLQLLS